MTDFGLTKLIPKRNLPSSEMVVPMVGLLYFACFATGLILRSLIQGGSLAQYQIFFIPLASLATLCALLIWWIPKAGYVAAAIMSVALIAIFFLTRDGNDAVTVLLNPGRNYVQFAFYITAVPQFFSTLAFSLANPLRQR